MAVRGEDERKQIFLRPENEAVERRAMARQKVAPTEVKCEFKSRVFSLLRCFYGPIGS